MSKFGMRNKSVLLSIVLVVFVFPLHAQKSADLIVAKERAALDRWKTGDTFGFVDIAANDITYFDPGRDKRCDGIEEFRSHLASFKGTFSFPSYELLNPKVQLYGEVSVLTFNFVSHEKDGKGERWNATEVYRLTDGEWKLASSHWSRTQPEKSPGK